MLSSPMPRSRPGCNPSLWRKQAAQKAFDLAKSRYTSGLTDFQVVLDSQRSLLSAQDQRVVSEAQVTTDLIGLYKTLGGGWTPMSSTAEPLKKSS